MNAQGPHRGSAPVGYVAELGPIEARAVRYLRVWYDGPDSQTEIWNELCNALGPEASRSALLAFEGLLDLCLRHSRRPLMRHEVSSACLGADESCFANFVGYASEGEREDALMIAATLVRPDMAPPLVGLAEDVGLAFRRMGLKRDKVDQTFAATNVFH